MRRFVPNLSTGNLAIVLTALATLVVGALVYRVAWTAEEINDRARSIDDVAVTIDEAALAVTNLGATNDLASSILASATPLDDRLALVAALAESVDGHATSINGSAATVVGTAGTIDATAKGVVESAGGINGRAAEILGIAESIMRGVDQINANLDDTIDVVSRVESDTTNILGQAGAAHQNASCIDAALGGVDGHC
ncbi:MAG: hypothetical protein H0W25_00050 [Acidimicrobiia bacterium]|nr:hypothetical protein [Acidimicrobiia bacterium]